MQAARFLVCGGAATGTHWVAMALLVRLGAAPLSATMAGAIIGSILN